MFSFNVHSNEVIGLLGPNGAGKTTSFYMVAGLLASDGGDIYLDGQNIKVLQYINELRLVWGICRKKHQFSPNDGRRKCTLNFRIKNLDRKKLNVK